MDQMLIERCIETLDGLKKTLEEMREDKKPKDPVPDLCPYCGGEAEIVKMEFEDEVFIQCTDCLAEIPWYPGRKEAIEAWNRRV